MEADHAEADSAEAMEEDLAADHAEALADRATITADQEAFGDQDRSLAAGITVRITAEADALADCWACLFFPLY